MRSVGLSRRRFLVAAGSGVTALLTLFFFSRIFPPV
jgi:hypothetical protein